jgi:hypothetical protein
VPVLKRPDQHPLYVRRRRNSDPVLKLTGDDECMRAQRRRNSGPACVRQRDSDPVLKLTWDDEVPCERMRRCSDPMCVRQRSSDPGLSDTDPVLCDTEADHIDASTTVDGIRSKLVRTNMFSTSSPCTGSRSEALQGG